MVVPVELQPVGREELGVLQRSHHVGFEVELAQCLDFGSRCASGNTDVRIEEGLLHALCEGDIRGIEPCDGVGGGRTRVFGVGGSLLRGSTVPAGSLLDLPKLVLEVDPLVGCSDLGVLALASFGGDRSVVLRSELVDGRARGFSHCVADDALEVGRVERRVADDGWKNRARVSAAGRENRAGGRCGERMGCPLSLQRGEELAAIAARSSCISSSIVATPSSRLGSGQQDGRAVEHHCARGHRAAGRHNSGCRRREPAKRRAAERAVPSAAGGAGVAEGEGGSAEITSQ